MTPQKQTICNFTEGNCFAACVASVLDLPLEEVPNFCVAENWMEVFQDWLAARGLAAVTLEWDPDYIRKTHPLALLIVSGPAPSRPKEQHACVYRGTRPLFDPFPYKGAVDLFFDGRTPETYIVLFPLDPAVALRRAA